MAGARGVREEESLSFFLNDRRRPRPPPPFVGGEGAGRGGPTGPPRPTPGPRSDTHDPL